MGIGLTGKERQRFAGGQPVRCDPPPYDSPAERSKDWWGETSPASSNRNKHASSALTLACSMQRAGSAPFQGRRASRFPKTKRGTVILHETRYNLVATTQDLARRSIGSRFQCNTSASSVLVPTPELEIGALSHPKPCFSFLPWLPILRG